MVVTESYKIYKCQINHEGEWLDIRCWSPDRKPAGSILIIHDICEGIDDYLWGIEKLLSFGFKVYGFELKVDHPIKKTKHGHKLFPKTFKKLTVEVLQVIAYTKSLEKGRPPFLLTQGVGSLVGLINSRKHAQFVSGLIACSPMFQIQEKIKPLQRLMIRTLSDFLPKLTLPRILAPTLTSTRKIMSNGETKKVDQRVSSREAYEYLKAIGHSRRNLAKLNCPTLILCPERSSAHKYTFLKSAISNHKHKDKIELIQMHTEFHAAAGDKARELETYEKYIIPWLNKVVDFESN